MEDGSDGITSSVHERQPLSSPTVNNGEVMANYPLDPEDNKPSKPVEEETVSINGEVAPSVDDDTEIPKHDSSDCDDTLVIDEEVELNPQEENRETTPEIPEINETLEETKPETVEITSERENCNNVAVISKPQPDKKRKLKRLLSKSKYKKIKTKAVEDDEVNSVLAPHSNPYFSQSIFELSTQYSPKKSTASKVSVVESKATKKVVQKKEKEKAKVTATPKPREYTQCLGLQPNVQFKCSKCGLSEFPSLVALNEHLGECLESVAPSVNSSGVPIPTNGPSSSSNLRFSRKVFLCSSCGTYYENWNLFLHMREIHHRFICLYCLGMFPHPEKLSVHLINKHNCSPKHYETATDYLNTVTEPCFLMCCDCRQVFTEQDQIDAHSCIAGPSDQSRVLPVITIDENKIMNKEDPPVLVNSDKSTEAVTDNSPGKEETTDKSNSEERPPEESESRTETVDKQTPSRDNNNSSVVLDDSVESMNISESKSLEDNLNESTVDKSDFSQDNSELSNDNFELSMTNNENSNDLANVTTEDADVNMEDSGLPSVKESVQRDVGRILCEKIPEVEDETTTTLLKSDVEEEKYENSDEKEVTNEKCMAENDQDGMESMDEEEDIEERVVEEIKTVKPFTIDTRKVPKVTLKLPKIPYLPEPEEDEDDDYYQDDDSSDSDKLTMQIEEPETPQLETNSQPYNENLPTTQSPTVDKTEEPELETNDTNMEQSENDSAVTVTDGTIGSQLPVAGVDVPVMELELEQPLDKMDVQVLLRQCLTVTIPYCLYCNHARKIAVNGKQLALHAIAEHRYSAIVKSITEEELIPESFNARLRDSLDELDLIYFNLEASEEVTYSQVFECFQCRYSTTIHKELYLHNRKLHAKALLLCIMCKTSFLNYSELVCHRCPGFYDIGRVQQGEGSFRCCMCVGERAELPSAFRLMVHLRKRHHLCDVCMESCHSQLKLSSHVWKHKLNHFCYRCGIAYRNKADITKHLYWKHGTESVNCKRCLQKRWPHVYHFCQPAASFTCDDCGLSFSRAVSLRVHRRLHDGEDGSKPHVCEVEECGERFISKRLRAKHEFKHREPEESVEDVKKEEDSKQEDGEKGAGDVEVVDGITITVDDEKQTDTPAAKEEVEAEEKPEKSKGKVDVYDLPALNLSESDSSDSEDESNQRKPDKSILDSSVLGLDSKSELKTETDGTKPAIVSDSIWDNFKNYQAAKSKLEDNSLAEITPILTDIAPPLTPESVLRDHDYCLVTADVMVESDPIREEMDISADHDYCTEKKPTAGETDKKPEIPGKKPVKTTQSSSDSDSSSCTCGSNCSCSSSSASSSSSENSSSDSSSSEGRRRQRAKREKKRQKKSTKVVNNATVDSEKPGKDPASSGEQLVVVDVVKSEKGIREVVIEENDLWTTESDTDEDFYEEHPQKFALKLLAEKRERLLQKVDEDLQMNGSLLGSRPPTPSTLLEEPRTKQRKKSKSKKKKKKKSSSRRNRNRAHNLSSQPQLIVAPLTLSIKNSPVSNTPIYSPVLPNPNLTVTITSSANHHYNHHHHHHHHTTSTPTNHNNTVTTAGGTTEENLRASKRRRVPNKFYGYSSDEESNSTTMATPVLLQPPVTIPVMKFRKVDLPSPAPKSPLTVPPLTIKTSGLTTVSTPTVQPISIRVSATTPGELRVQPSRPTAPPGATVGAGRQRFSRPPPIPPPQRFIPKFQRELDLTPLTPLGGTTITHHQSPPPPPPPNYDRPPVVPPPAAPREDSATESNETSSDDEDDVVVAPPPPTVAALTSTAMTPRVPPVAPPLSRMLIQPPPGVTSVVMQGGLVAAAAAAAAAGGVPGKDQPALYCYCRCPYDEVSEMIGCDSDECVIEWFHFECVGIMVPPKGQWFCPDCRKKKQQRRELLQQQLGMGV